MRHVLFWALILSGFCCRAAEPPEITLALVNDESRQIDKKTYHLMAIKLDWGPAKRITDNTLLVFFFNGKSGWNFLSAADQVPDANSLSMIQLNWVELPADGKVEVVYGNLSNPDNGKTEADYYQAALKHGLVPQYLDVKQIPHIQAKSAKELEQKLKQVTVRPAPVTK